MDTRSLPGCDELRRPAIGVTLIAGLAFVAVVGVSAGCGPGTELADGFTDPTPNCTACHGENGNPAPPRSLSGSADTREIGVGAHREHLMDNPIRGAIRCSECHKVPKTVGERGHVDALPAEVTFGPLAQKNVDALWDREHMTCATYCHGASLKGGLATSPQWTIVDGSQVHCDSCHGFPPPAPHTPSKACSTCHDATVDADDRILLDGGKHIDGVVDVKGPRCDACHGGTESGPPPGLAGETTTDAPGVGAHAAHVSGAKHAPIDCATCHVVPHEVEDPGHIDDADARAEVTFGGLAVHNAKRPTYADLRCSNTYCHGGDTPTWNVVDGRSAACNACHLFPPAGLHPQRTDCAACHGNVVNADLTFIAPALHVDGVVEIAGAPCDACHGGDGQSAPPRDTQGNTATSFTGVGAHASHLASSRWHAAVACQECHVVPTDVDARDHIDTPLPAEVTFGGLARARGATPAWDGVGCSNVACHGGATPTWTVVDGTQAACGTCHGLPPVAPHPARTDCAACHSDVIDRNGVFVGAARHINGSVDVTCNACHGDAGSAAPPGDLAGNVSTTFEGVGAHRAHLGPSDLHAVVACSECHVVPATVDAPGHIDAALPAEVVFGPLASSNGVVARIQDLHCNVYCHGGDGSVSGGSNNSPQWTRVDGTQGSCGTCHGLPPPAPHPPSLSTSCEGCHSFVGLRPIDPTTHINGTVEVN